MAVHLSFLTFICLCSLACNTSTTSPTTKSSPSSLCNKCELGQYCKNNQCTNGCLSDLNCAKNQVCQKQPNQNEGTCQNREDTRNQALTQQCMDGCKKIISCKIFEESWKEKCESFCASTEEKSYEGKIINACTTDTNCENTKACLSGIKLQNEQAKGLLMIHWTFNNQASCPDNVKKVVVKIEGVKQRIQATRKCNEGSGTFKDLPVRQYKVYIEGYDQKNIKTWRSNIVQTEVFDKQTIELYVNLVP